MKKTKNLNTFAWFKEKVRKFFVALKKNPQVVPLVGLCLSFFQYSLNLTDISDTTARIQGKNMGLAAFVAMLFMILSFVCMLGAFPKRQKPNILMNVLLRVMYAAVIAADLHYLNCIDYALYYADPPTKITTSTIFIYNAYQAVNLNVILVAITLALVIFEPTIAFLLKKIKTSIEVEDAGVIESIDITDED